MGWQLFSWILAGGAFSMVWFLYLSIKQDDKRWKLVAQPVRRYGRDQRMDNTLANA